MLGFAWVAFGLYAIGVGLYTYLAPGAEHRVRNAYLYRTGLVFASALYGAIPIGLSMICLGLSTIIPIQPISGFLTDGSLVLLVVAGLAMIWHPNWIRPRWARDTKNHPQLKT